MFFQVLRLNAHYIDALEKRYNPEQPRVPAGHPDGGEWTTAFEDNVSRYPLQAPAGGAGVQLAVPRRYAALEVHSDATRTDVTPGYELAQGPGYPIDLLDEEGRGGHAIGEHVGKSEAFLLEGVTEAARVMASAGYEVGGLRSGSFPTLEAANKLVNATVSRNPEKVALVVNGLLPIAAVEAEFGSPTGYEAYAKTGRSQPVIRETYSVRVIIVPDRNSARGFRVLTAFPVSPDR